MDLKTVTVKPEHSQALADATAIRNAHYKARDADAVELTPDEYLAELVERQLDGLREAVTAEKALAVSIAAMRARAAERRKFDQ